MRTGRTSTRPPNRLRQTEPSAASSDATCAAVANCPPSGPMRPQMPIAPLAESTLRYLPPESMRKRLRRWRGCQRPGAGVSVPPAGSRAGADVPAAGVQANVNSNAWRYRWHDNRWWYYHPNNRWSFWNNNRWNLFPVPAATAANNGTTRRFSNTPRYESGYRGPSVNSGTGAARAVRCPAVPIRVRWSEQTRAKRACRRGRNPLSRL